MREYDCRGCGQPKQHLVGGRPREFCPTCLPDSRARNRYTHFKLTEPQFQAMLKASDYLARNR